MHLFPISLSPIKKVCNVKTHKELLLSAQADIWLNFIMRDMVNTKCTVTSDPRGKYTKKMLYKTHF